jgi:hypothetical protein
MSEGTAGGLRSTYISGLAVGAAKSLPVVKPWRSTGEYSGLAGLVLRSVCGTRGGVDGSPVVVRVDAGVSKDQLPCGWNKSRIKCFHSY